MTWYDAYVLYTDRSSTGLTRVRAKVIMVWYETVSKFEDLAENLLRRYLR